MTTTYNYLDFKFGFQTRIERFKIFQPEEREKKKKVKMILNSKICNINLSPLRSFFFYLTLRMYVGIYLKTSFFKKSCNYHENVY